ncbi:MAG TPA: hypothetical protein VNE39_03980 [Planctomycetota bacterium]|nr:hypothetical protein [Planctomycetota bacterium]
MQTVAAMSLFLLLGLALAGAEAGELWIGAATADITPTKPVALAGQRHLRVSKKVDTPLAAAALALEARDGEKVLDQAIVISCDLVAIRSGIQERFREHVKPRLPGFDPQKLFLNASHTHTAPVTMEGSYEIPKEGVLQPAEYVEFLFARLADAAAKAWEGRKPGGVSWALGHAAVGSCRRAAYENGTARMYGATDTPTFRSIEGNQDPSVDMLFFWSGDKELLAVAINLACTAQEVEGLSSVNADFWHDVREALHKKHSKDLHVLPWCAPAGDQSPHLLYNKRAEERMRTLRGLTRTEEIARRIVGAVEDVLEVARKDIRTAVPFAHRVSRVKLPMRKATEAELARTRAKFDELSKAPTATPASKWELARCRRVLDRHEQQKTDPNHEIELHALRLGDVAIATNPFELYLDYGIQMKARSRAVQTFLIQLATDSGGYLPTEKAVRGGHYSAELVDNIAGPEGGKALVNATVAAINALWPAEAK